MLKLKAFIYRFSNIFGLHIYLASKEEQHHIDSLGKQSEISESCSRGCWQGKHGFTTIWTYRCGFFESLYRRISHAFRS